MAESSTHDSQNGSTKVISDKVTSEQPTVSTPSRDQTLVAGEGTGANGTALRVIARTIKAGRTAPTSPSPPSSSNLAMLAAHLPRVPRDAYAMGDQVARGGIGRVMRARDQRLDRPVAIKELLVWNEDQEERFVREAILTARLQHPAIVPVYEAARWPDGEPFYSMKLVSGRTLSDLIDEKKTLAERLALLPHVITIAQAVAYAHTQRILHRDLKPANVLVGEFGETVVIDWGLAKGIAEAEPSETENNAPTEPVSAVDGDGLTMEGAVVGTPAYMPPEQASGQKVDERADIYGIGAILYHLIAAVPPYSGVPWEKLLATIAKSPPRPVEKIETSISDELCAIVHKAMARDPADRYSTAKALADDLERFQTGHIVAAHTYSMGQLLKRFWRRNRTALSIAAAAISVVTLVVIGAFIKTERERRIALAHEKQAEEARALADSARQEAEKSERRAITRADDLTLLQARAALTRDPNEALAWLKTLSPSFSDAKEMRNIAADAYSRGISRVFRGHTAHVNSIILLGDGRRFVSMSDDKTARIWDIDKGEQHVLRGHTDEAWFAVELHGGERIMTVGKDATGRIWSVASGEQLGVVKLPSVAQQLRVRSDGAVVGSPSPHEGPVWVFSPGTNEVHTLTEPSEEVKASGISTDGRRAIVRLEDGSIFGLDTESRKRFPVKQRTAISRDNWWAMSGDGRVAARATTREKSTTVMEIWDVEAGAFREIRVPTGAEGRYLLTKSGESLVYAAAENVYVHDVKTGQLTHKLEGDGSIVYSLVLSDDGETLVTGGYNHVARVYRLATGETRSYSGLLGTVSWVSFYKDQRSILAASTAGDVRLFEPSHTGVTLTHHLAPSVGLAISKDGRVASMGSGGGLRINDLDGKLVAEHTFPAHPFWLIEASPDKAHFAAYWWDPTNLDAARSGAPTDPGSIVIGTFDEAKPTVVELTSPVSRLVWDPEGKSLIVASLNGTLLRVGLDGAVKDLAQLSQPIPSLAIAPTSKELAAGCEDGLVRLVDLSTGRYRDLDRHAEPVFSMVFSNDSKTLVTGSGDHTFRVWKLEDGSFRSFEASGGGVRQIELSKDQKTLFVRNDLETFLRRYDLETGKELPRLTGHTGPILGFSISADGAHVVTGSTDRTARIFDIATGKSRALTGHQDDVTSALFEGHTSSVITLSRDGAVRRWPDDLPMTIAELRKWLDAATPDTVKGH